jgi:murein DD-endopeptidase MepM/ murein hydrolase activator NlpD
MPARTQPPRGLPPVEVLVLRSFDPPSQRWLSGHRGVDLTTEPGAAVRSPAAGIVAFAGTIAGRNVLVVDHGTLRSTFEPVTSDLSVGDAVMPGEVVGRISTGTGHCGAGNCLHWGVILGDDYLDPLALLGTLRPRLLPLVGDPT